MRDFLYRLARRVYPKIDSFTEAERGLATGSVALVILLTPYLLAGLIWLIAITEVSVFAEHWPTLAGIFGVMLLFSFFSFRLYFVTPSGGYFEWGRQFSSDIVWSGALVFGPSAFWLLVPMALLRETILGWRANRLKRLMLITRGIFNIGLIPVFLAGFAVYRWLGGVIPLSGLAVPVVLPAIVATVAAFGGAGALLLVPYQLWQAPAPHAAGEVAARQEGRRFALLMVVLTPIVGQVAVLAAGLYSVAGVGVYFAFVGVLLGFNMMANFLANTIESSRHRTHEMAQLTRLGQAVIKAPPDGSTLPDLLLTHTRGMFALCRVTIRLEPDRTLIIQPEGWDGPDAAVWSWQRDLREPRVFGLGQPRPWDEPRLAGTLIVPIVAVEGGTPRGRLYIRRVERAGNISRLLPAAQALADQIASTLRSAEVYQQTLAERLQSERVTQELAFAGQVQSSFLPTATPQLDGWEIAAALLPARETSGDFYDFIPFGDGRLGLVVGDVADKGLGAAFYMALARTLLRTYAIDYSVRYPDTYLSQIDRVLDTTNARILADTTTDLFVTLFYGLLDTQTNTLTYANAGHNPPYHFNRRRVRALGLTGLPLGLFKDSRWKRSSVRVNSGDLLVLYTDGLTEAQDSSQEFFGEGRLQEIVRDNLNLPCHDLCDTILKEVTTFAGDSPHADDITLIVVRRE